MFEFFKCFIIRTKYDEQGCYKQHNTTADSNIQCHLHVETKDASVQCCIESVVPSHRHVFLRDKAIYNLPFELYENGNNEKYIMIKEEQVFLRHIKGHFKYDQPWIYK